MRITDELRKWAHEHVVYGMQTTLEPPIHPLTFGTKEEVLSIADRIDVVHKDAIQQALIDKGGVPATDENMAELGWMRPPVDDDGEVVRVGSLCKVYPFVEPAKRVRALRVSEFGWFVIFEDGTEEQRYRIRVYKPPTTEDVLCEMLEKAVGYSDAHTTVALNVIDEYAKRLQLKENA